MLSRQVERVEQGGGIQFLAISPKKSDGINEDTFLFLQNTLRPVGGRQRLQMGNARFEGSPDWQSHYSWGFCCEEPAEGRFSMHERPNHGGRPKPCDVCHKGVLSTRNISELVG
ncbi:unnamed protein product [Durusdinium trenchii]|uniref:Uncharacterized protein n=1 Tax=Durusdinium trenchii TaxID=1381693 RepID=A0ABP0SYE6_9DINO